MADEEERKPVSELIQESRRAAARGEKEREAQLQAEIKARFTEETERVMKERGAGQVVINPSTGQIKTVTPSEYKALGTEWKQTSPTLDQTAEAKKHEGVAVSVLTKNIKTGIQTQGKDYDIKPIIEQVGQKAVITALEPLVKNKADASKYVQAVMQETAPPDITIEQPGTQVQQQKDFGYQIRDTEGNVKFSVQPSAISMGLAPTFEEVQKALAEGKQVVSDKGKIVIKESEIEIEVTEEEAPEIPANLLEDPETGNLYKPEDLAPVYGKKTQFGTTLADAKGRPVIDWDRLRQDQSLARVVTLFNKARNSDSLSRSDIISQVQSTGNKYEKAALQKYLDGERELIASMVNAGIDTKDATMLVRDYGANAAAGMAQAAVMAKAEQAAIEAIPQIHKEAKYISVFRNPAPFVDYGGLQKNTMLGNVITATGGDKDKRIEEIRDAVEKEYGDIPPRKNGFSEYYDLAWKHLTPDEQRGVIDFYTNRAAKKEAGVEAMLDMVPVYGTYRIANRHGLKSGWTIVSIVGDAAIVAGPLVKAAGVGVSALRTTGYGVVRVPLESGKTAAVWRGVRVLDNPVIGRADSKLVVGKGQIPLPKAEEFVQSYRPLSKLETNILATPEAMAKMGFPAKEIQKVVETINTRNTFVGKKSPYLAKNIITDPIESLSNKGVELILKEAARNKDITMVYGSGTIKQQLEPSLRNWRSIGDIDVQTNLSDAATKDMAKRLAETLKKTEGAENVKVRGSLIETKDAAGKWHHAVDLHSKADEFTSQIEGVIDYTRTGTYSYGAKVAQKTATVKYPNIGRFSIMGLSESGIRKADTIVRWFGKEVRVPEHRVKDIIDYYVILRTYRGEAAAEAWAKAYGIDPREMMRLIKQSAIESKEYPGLNVTSWRFDPVKQGASPKALADVAKPTVKVTSPSLKAVAAQPYNYGFTPVSTVRSGAAYAKIQTKKPSVRSSPAMTKKESQAVGAYLGLSPELEPSPTPLSPPIKGVESYGGVYYIPQTPGEVYQPSPDAPSPPVPPPPSPPVPPPPSPPVPPPPSPPVPPPPTGDEPEKKKPRPILPSFSFQDGTRSTAKLKGMIAWYQGKVGKYEQWYFGKWPYRGRPDFVRILSEVPISSVISPEKGEGAAKRSYQVVYGEPPDKELTFDMGIQDIILLKDLKVEYVPDPKQETNLKIDLGSVTTANLSRRAKAARRRGMSRTSGRLQSVRK